MEMVRHQTVAQIASEYSRAYRPSRLRTLGDPHPYQKMFFLPVSTLRDVVRQPGTTIDSVAAFLRVWFVWGRKFSEK